MRIGRLLALFIGLPFLGACVVGPDYKAPDMDAPAEFVSQELLKSLNEGKTDADFSAQWWMGFTDPILDQLVTAGLDNNFQLVAARARVKEASARLALAGAGDELQTEAGLDQGLEAERNLNDADTTKTASVSGGLSVALPLDVFGRTAREVEAALAGLQAAKAELRGRVLGISSEITREYLRLRGSQRQLVLLVESVHLQEKTLSIVKSRYEAGLSPELDMRRAETSVENLRAGIPPLKEALTNARNRLASLTGQYPGVYETLLHEHQEIPVYKGKFPELVPLAVLTQRPDIRQTEEELKRAVARIGLAEAEYYPTFRLIGAINIGATGVTGAPALNVLTASLGALIDQVVTDGGARKANVEIAQSQAEEALALYRDTLLSASEEVEISLAAIKSSLDRQSSLQKAVKSSEISFYQAETLYQQGLISFLDVVDAQRVLANGEQQLASERTNYATEIATLFRVLGTEIKAGT
ncbi:MAG: efflux transporter outer membrane subunit [Candidatus Nitrohelix vancouverensis]|uniref:Efflux transporter outer membrane subunit n=1 Tax=Candidatus Nitrohelix vancouverensis TaxID=2705534 RepID=A0A7T0G3W4_9BACT|nr:MAG: efflux transporter outer membrane subunit [Candidatus Nitrohelix vancouverensis]